MTSCKNGNEVINFLTLRIKVEVKQSLLGDREISNFVWRHLWMTPLNIFQICANFSVQFLLFCSFKTLKNNKWLLNKFVSGKNFNLLISFTLFAPPKPIYAVCWIFENFFEALKFGIEGIRSCIQILSFM